MEKREWNGEKGIEKREWNGEKGMEWRKGKGMEKRGKQMKANEQICIRRKRKIIG